MSDERLRALERTWRSTGALGDEAALLLEHARAGRGTPAQREVAACLGEAFSTLPAIEPHTWRYADDESEGLSAWERWALGSSGLSVEARGRLLLAPAADAYRVWTRGRRFGREEWVTETLWSLEEAVLAGRSDVVEQGGLAFDAAHESGESPGAEAASAVGHAARALAPDAEPIEALLAFREAAMASSGVWIVATLRAETVPWALGLRDVVAERVAERAAAEGR